jgi:quinohemoprotein ethanol dehydrogenase
MAARSSAYQIANCCLVFLACQLLSPLASGEVGSLGNWASHAGGTDESGYSRLEQINKSSIARLKLAWSLDLPGEGSLEAIPLAIDGVLYFTGSYAVVYAVDATNGRLRWKYDPEVWKHNPAKMRYSFAINRGVAYADGRVFAAALDGRLFALDARTGRVLWSVQTVSPESTQIVSGAPRTFDGKVIIGNNGADVGARGYATAYWAATGKLAWRFYTAPGSPKENAGDAAMQRAAATWTGEYWKTGTGGAVWDNITYDAELNRVYLGTGNAGPWDPAVRSPGGGDNLYTSSIVALDATTGQYVWHYQINPRDSWDYDATQQMTLAWLSIDGRSRKVLMQAPKNGFFYVIDRLSGKLISAEKLGKVTWAERIDVNSGRPVEVAGIRYESGETTIWPSPLGAHSWQSMSYSAQTGLVYLPYMQLGARFARSSNGMASYAGLNIQQVSTDTEDGKAKLIAWDPVHRRKAWEMPEEGFWNGGTLATAGALVFQGDALGHFSAYDAQTGTQLWRFNAGLGISAAPMSFQVRGKQYIAILVGYAGSAGAGGALMNVGWKFGVQPKRLLVFALDGRAVLPPLTPRDLTVNAVDDESIHTEQTDVDAGHTLYGRCFFCHGRDLVASGGFAPDLRESPAALDPQTLWAIVHDGALMQYGMPRFEMLTRDQVRQIYAYIRSGARAVKKGAVTPDASEH